jgi:hypothetical protein
VGSFRYQNSVRIGRAFGRDPTLDKERQGWGTLRYTLCARFKELHSRAGPPAVRSFDANLGHQPTGLLGSRPSAPVVTNPSP